MKKVITTSNQKGFTLFEMLIGAIIFSLLAAVIIPQLTSVKDKNILVTQEIGMMRTSLLNIEDRYYDEFIDGDLDNQEMIEGKMISSSYRVNGDVIYNLFDGAVTITGVGDNGLVWVSEGITEVACAKLIDDAKTLGFETVDVGGNSVTYLGARNSDFTSACISGLGNNETVTVTWTREAQ